LVLSSIQAAAIMISFSTGADVKVTVKLVPLPPVAFV